MIDVYIYVSVHVHICVCLHQGKLSPMLVHPTGILESHLFLFFFFCSFTYCVVVETTIICMCMHPFKENIKTLYTMNCG